MPRPSRNTSRHSDSQKKGALAKWDGERLEDESQYSCLLVSGVDLAEQSAKRAAFDRVEFERTDLRGARFVDATLRDVCFRACDLANAQWRGTFLSGVEVIDSKILGLSAGESKFRDCVFQSCNGRMASFRFASLRGVSFEDCNLAEADFQSADLTGAAFARCDLRGVQMSGAKLAGANLCGSQIEGLLVNATDVMGVTIDAMQAVYLVSLLGVKIKW